MLGDNIRSYWRSKSIHQNDVWWWNVCWHAFWSQLFDLIKYLISTQFVIANIVDKRLFEGSVFKFLAFHWLNRERFQYDILSKKKNELIQQNRKSKWKNLWKLLVIWLDSFQSIALSSLITRWISPSKIFSSKKFPASYFILLGVRL